MRLARAPRKALLPRPLAQDQGEDHSDQQEARRSTERRAHAEIVRLDAADTRDYIWHRLRHVGGTGDEISVYAVKAIYEESDGIPAEVHRVATGATTTDVLSSWSRWMITAFSYRIGDVPVPSPSVWNFSTIFHTSLPLKS